MTGDKLATVCFCTMVDGPEVYVMHNRAFGERTVREAMATSNGTVGRLEDVMSGAYSTRACLICEYGSLTTENFAIFGTDIAEAWCAAFSEYVYTPPIVRPLVKEGRTVVNIDRKEYIREHSFKASPLPVLLFVGPDDMCNSRMAGRWAFDRLVVCHSVPSEDERLLDISEDVRCPSSRPEARAGTV